MAAIKESVLAMRLGTPAENLNEDQALVAAAQNDPEAAGRLFDKYYAEVFGYVYRSTLDRAVTEDLTSNVFLSAFRHLGFFRWRRVPFGAWLYRIATNEIRMHYRRQKRIAATCSEAISLDVASESLTAMETLAATEDYRLLHHALLGLRLKYRTVILLRYFESKSIPEIASITGKAEGTIKSQLHRGLERLQTALERLGVTPL
ncbi:putative RNA polymerase ECF-type sigma factor [Verrucomicrobia bacterium]|nr:putative RNA polymerase ECF-type sigma factor [Verrucomicrobiota bacterium]